jgi:two-component system, OmpR family, sensor kinase
MFSLFRSLRWRLQSWHAMILLSVLVGFGSLLHWEMVRAHWDRIDEELLGAARILEGSMLAVPPAILEALAQDVFMSGPRMPSSNPNRPRRPEGKRPEDKRPGDRRSEDRNPPPISSPQILPSRIYPYRNWKFPGADTQDLGDRTEEEWEASIQLPAQLPEQLGRNQGAAYFFIWRSDGSVLRESNAPAQPPTPNDEVFASLQRDRMARQQRGPFREVFIRGPRETLICVGRSALREREKMAGMTWMMIASGLSVLGIGLIGGWWLSKRAIEPIQLMSRTAQGINANQLTDRIKLSGFDTELAGLGATLNTMLDRLSQAFEQQRQFTADASHELRTPVSIILTSSELALSKPREPEEYREQLVKCKRAAERMRQLTESLLTLARLDSTTNIEMTNVDVEALLQDAVSSIQLFADAKSIAIHSQLEHASLQGNETLLRQAIGNLLSNAIKYSRPEGEVFVRLLKSKDYATIEVEDHGIGIPESAIPRLFDRFYRVDESRARTEGGTGLGLSIAERIVHCHRGQILVESVLGEGSTFRIALPLPS